MSRYLSEDQPKGKPTITTEQAKEILARKIVHVESIELGEYKLLQMTLYTNGVVEVTSIIDGKWMELEVSKSLFFQAALRLLEKDV